MTLSVTNVPPAVLTDAGGSAVTISFTNPPALGSGVFLAYTDAVAANPILNPTVGDNQTSGHIYKFAISGNDPTSGQMAGVWYLEKVLTTAGTYTITVTNNATTNNYSLIGIGEITTSGGGISLDQVKSGTVNGTSPVTATVTTTTTAEVWISAMTVDGAQANQGIGTAFSGGTQFMVEQNDTAHIAAAGDYKVATVSGATASYAIAQAHAGAVAVIATFQEVFGGGTTTTLSPTVGSEVFGGQTPNLTLQLGPSVGSEVFGGQTPSLTLQLVPTVGSEVFSGQQPTLTQSFLLSPSEGSEIYSGLTPSMTLQFSTTEGLISWSGNQPSISQTGGQGLHFNRRHGRVYYN